MNVINNKNVDTLKIKARNKILFRIGILKARNKALVEFFYRIRSCRELAAYETNEKIYNIEMAIGDGIGYI
jgi:hypothetical protein